MKKLALILACSALAACQTSNFQGVAAIYDDPLSITPERQNELIEESLQGCYDFFGVKSAEAEKKAKTAWRWTLAGLVSGAVIAPALTAANAAANATWISAFSGFSGVSAIAVNNANNYGIGPASSVDGLIVIANSVRADLIIANNKSLKYEERAAAAGRADLSCRNPVTVAGYVKANINAEQQKETEAKIDALSKTVAELQKKLADTGK